MSEKINSARCYGTLVWQAYQAGILGESERIEMEEHLLVCESCLETYLNIIENRLNNEEIAQLGEDFTNQVLYNIEQEKRWQKASAQVTHISTNKKLIEERSNRVNLLISYCAAASIAMFFWVGGYFDGLSGTFMKGMEYMQTAEVLETRGEPQKSFIQTGWTQKVIEKKHPSFIENLIMKKE